ALTRPDRRFTPPHNLLRIQLLSRGAGEGQGVIRCRSRFIAIRCFSMPISMYQASVPAALQMLASLSAIIDKAVAHAAARKIEPSVLLNARLYPDMFPLVRQVQLTADHAKGMAARLAGIEVPKFPDTETSFDELKARLAKTADFVQSLKPAQVDGSENRELTIPIPSGPLLFTGQ